MLKTQAIATATTTAHELPSFQIPARFRSLGIKAIVVSLVVSLVMAIAYFGFAINVGARAATTAEHLINTAQHSLAANFDAPYIQHYGFKSLFPAQQRVYADIYRAAYLTRDMVTVNDMTESEISELVQVICNDSPELFYLNPEVAIETTTITTAAEHTTATVHLSYTFDKQEIPEARENFESKLTETAAVASTCQSDANKVNMIQGWMQENTTTAVVTADADDVEDQAKDAHTATAYDVLMNGETSNEGNAQLFTALCSEAGVDSHVVTDADEDATDNATNAVMLGSSWHYVNITDENAEVLT